MSDSESDIPDVKTCDRLCKEFASITETDTACAQFYLQDRSWDLQKSLNDFYGNLHGGSTLRTAGKDGTSSEVVLVVDGSQPSLAAAASAIVTETLTAKANGSRRSASSRVVENPETLKLISWNIDGIDQKNLRLRTEAVCKTILNEKPDVVFLQEVIPETASQVEHALPDYKCIFGGEAEYFTAILLKKASVWYQDHHIVPFPDTRMGRNIISVQVKVSDLDILLMTSHFESTKEHANERKNQLKIVLKQICDPQQTCSVLFGGDLNLRDKETRNITASKTNTAFDAVSHRRFIMKLCAYGLDEQIDAIGGLPCGIEDLWISCGSRKECAYTWDLTRNDNLTFNGKFKPRMRFDRVYLKKNSRHNIVPKHFGFVGLERLLPHRCFPSDHWGLLCLFNISQ